MSGPGQSLLFHHRTEPDAVFAYGDFRPEEARRNRFASRTSPLVGLKVELRAGETGAISAYGAPLTGTSHRQRFEALGTSGPFFLDVAPVATGTDEA